MKEVDEGKIEKIVEPEHGDGGEEGIADPEHGQDNDAAHQEGEQGPVVEQGRVLLECQQISSVPVKLFENPNNNGSPEQIVKAIIFIYQTFAYLPNMAIVPPGHISTR